MVRAAFTTIWCSFARTRRSALGGSAFREMLYDQTASWSSLVPMPTGEPPGSRGARIFRGDDRIRARDLSLRRRLLRAGDGRDSEGIGSLLCLDAARSRHVVGPIFPAFGLRLWASRFSATSRGAARCPCIGPRSSMRMNRRARRLAPALFNERAKRIGRVGMRRHRDGTP